MEYPQLPDTLDLKDGDIYLYQGNAVKIIIRDIGLTKRCPKCKMDKSRKLYYVNNTKFDKVSTHCRDCHRKMYLGKKQSPIS